MAGRPMAGSSGTGEWQGCPQLNNGAANALSSAAWRSSNCEAPRRGWSVLGGGEMRKLQAGQREFPATRVELGEHREH